MVDDIEVLDPIKQLQKISKITTLKFRWSFCKFSELIEKSLPRFVFYPCGHSDKHDLSKIFLESFYHHVCSSKFWNFVKKKNVTQISLQTVLKMSTRLSLSKDPAKLSVLPQLAKPEQYTFCFCDKIENFKIQNFKRKTFVSLDFSKFKWQNGKF